MYDKLNVALSKDLRKKYGIRSFPIVKGDVVKVVSGARKGEGGKVAEVDHHSGLVIVEGITIAKIDGKQKGFGISPEKLQITHLDLSRSERFQKIKELANIKHITIQEEPIQEEQQKTEETKQEIAPEEVEAKEAQDKQEVKENDQ
ncbi:ribosomal protein large subunit L26 [Thermoplasma volcanium GSS1]|uniref:Large ribosomal subunit protein uL24 n=1 Tax=Thermoplasma volcanium (strain ATCC 51530 / DSM 4299 / JCM 9571 / NBRC 15438 / GSS1) TaxID=273116 RepID=RL24_THEVO|nr:50S ribosomal protein L24 [Thermoplasma volcanium]Q97BW5.1 RecName: Full=Large ribosomal subunit protein uL24; AltName: Full=50S ribosomal protein L24 [Thermoplasma volcanium GSS1]BAB59482.1 ribosomal protein large subunit L26 [Thermoplasma volcanium GSS1]